MGGLDDERREILYKNWPRREILYKNWPHAKSNFFSSLPVDPNSVEQCQRIHHHQRFLKTGLLRDAGSTPDAEAPPKRSLPILGGLDVFTVNVSIMGAVEFPCRLI